MPSMLLAASNDRLSMRTSSCVVKYLVARSSLELLILMSSAATVVATVFAFYPGVCDRGGNPYVLMMYVPALFKAAITCDFYIRAVDLMVSFLVLLDVT